LSGKSTSWGNPSRFAIIPPNTISGGIVGRRLCALADVRAGSAREISGFLQCCANCTSKACREDARRKKARNEIREHCGTQDRIFDRAEEIAGQYRGKGSVRGV
jgi:hypothetical protein